MEGLITNRKRLGSTAVSYGMWYSYVSYGMWYSYFNGCPLDLQDYRQFSPWHLTTFTDVLSRERLKLHSFSYSDV